MNINKILTPYNLSVGSESRIKYIVIHYVGATGGARANCEYYASQKLNASAHYFVGFEGEIYQSVLDKDVAWHCGAATYKHPACRNSNSIGIEMCVRNKGGDKGAESKDWYFEDATVKATIELVKWLMAKYNVPVENVIRHNDVTGKVCPNPYVYNHTGHTWGSFKAAISGTGQTTPPAPPAPTPPPSEPRPGEYTKRQFVLDVQNAIGAKPDGIEGPETLGKTPTISKTKNNRHTVVRPLQERLNALGFDVGEADGIAGAKFDAGARKFQGSFGGVVDGEFTAGKLSWKKLLGMA